MSKFLPIKSENLMELAILAQKIKYHESTKCLEIPINALGNITAKGLNLFEDSLMESEERMDESNNFSVSFPILDLGI